MSHYPLTTLRDLLRPAQQTKGVVVRSSGSAVQVATSRGIESATPGAGVTVGSGVVLRAGVAHGIAVPARTYAL